MTQNIEAQAWNERYRAGKYNDEPPLPFVNTIIQDLGTKGRNSLGLYIGCGNGRNFVPLLEAGLNIYGVDISEVGIEQIIQKAPIAQDRVRVASFGEIRASSVWDYLVAIQVFQHGNTAAFLNYFRQARDLLKPNGRLYLRINSASTEIVEPYKQTENNKYGGFTVVYEQGDKTGGIRHFFTHQELEVLAHDHDFEILGPMFEVTEHRVQPQFGTWTQWETIWRKKMPKAEDDQTEVK